MAKQKGIITLEGTVGGLNFYIRKGKPVVRTAGGGFNGKAIKKSPRMVRVRENNSEFATCSNTNKVFKEAIRPFTLGYVDGTLHSRLMGLFLAIKVFDLNSERGQRQVWKGMNTVEGKRLLRTFRFTPKRAMLLPCTYSFDWTMLSFSAAGFDVKQVGFPVNSDYMTVTLGVVRFDFEILSYNVELSTPLVIERDFAGTDFSLAVASLPIGIGLAFALVRVAFYQTVNGQSYLLEGGGAFGLECVGVEGL